MGAVHDVGGGPGATRLDLIGSDRGARRRLARAPLLALAMATLVGATWGGLARLGWPLPERAAALAALHGPLMVAGFLGTVIALERAAALGRAWAYMGPVATALGAVALVAAPGAALGPALGVLGSGVVVAVFVAVLVRQAALFTVTMALGALAWLVGQALWLAGAPVHGIVWWWAAFLVLTIAGERLELARLGRISAASRAAFGAAVVLLLVSAALAPRLPAAGARLGGAALLALAAWLGRHDVARRTVRQAGLTRFIALCLLSGYGWLAVAGALALAGGGAVAGPLADATFHALFLGFVVAMIFGHAPVIFPALTGLAVPWRPAFYAHLLLLQAGLALRVGADLAGWWQGRRWGGLLNAAALALFLLATARAVLAGRRGR